MTDARSTAPSRPRAARWRRSSLALLVALVTAAAWAPSVRNGFVWDDQYDILRSTRLHQPRAVVDVFAHHAMWSADQPETAVATYRPLALATLAVDWQLWHARPAGYHATNVALHVLATLALFLALALLLGDDGVAAVLALLFALHPANAEAVAWINGRSEMLALGFGALALAAAATGRFVAMGGALALAMLGKETGVAFVPVAVVVALLARADGLSAGADARSARGDALAARADALPLRHDALSVGGRALRALVAAAAALACYGALRAFALGHTALPAAHARGALATLGPVWARTTFAALVPWRRAPIELSTWLASLLPRLRATWALAGALLAATTLVVAVVAHRRASRPAALAALGLGWWLLALAPTATIAALDYPWPGLGRWLYVGLPGLLLALHAVTRAVPASPRLAAAGVIAALFAVGGQRAIATWHDDAALYQAMIDETPDDAWAWRALGTAHLAANRDDDAAAAFHHAAVCDRTEEIHAAYALEAYAWARLGRCDAAAAQFYAHPVTPALSSEEFEAVLARCRNRLIQETRRVKSAHANEE